MSAIIYKQPRVAWYEGADLLGIIIEKPVSTNLNTS